MAFVVGVFLLRVPAADTRWLGRSSVACVAWNTQTTERNICPTDRELGWWTTMFSKASQQPVLSVLS